MLDSLIDLRLIDYVVIAGGFSLFIYIFATPFIVISINLKSETILENQKTIINKLEKLENGNKESETPEAPNLLPPGFTLRND